MDAVVLILLLVVWGWVCYVYPWMNYKNKKRD